MRKFLLSLLLLAVFSPLALRADEVIVGTVSSTTTAVVPFRNTTTDTYTQSIYPQTEVGGAMTITAVAFNCDTPTQSTTSNVKIYVGETDKHTHVNASDWLTEADGLTLVYEGANVTIGGAEWVNFAFNAPYEYSGTHNLVIAVSAAGTTANMNLKWKTATEEGTKPSMHNKDPYSTPSGINGTAGTTPVKGYRPIIKLTTTGNGGGETPENPEPEIPTLSVPVVTATAKNATQIELAWESVADSAFYQIYFGSDFIGATYETSYIVNNCYPETQHCFTVTATKDGVTTAASAPACATTPAQGEEPEQPEQPEQPENPDPTPDPEQPEQTEFPVSFYDNFDDAKYTNRWNRIDADGDGFNWGSMPYGAYAGYEETNGLYSACFSNGNTLNPDNYIYTNTKYSITETSALSFLHRESDMEYFEENFGVVISEDGVNFEVVWSKRYTEQDLHEEDVWGYDSISLAAYAGKNVYVGFRHYDCNGLSANAIKIDNVRLSTEYSNGEDEEEEDGPEFPTGDAVTVVIGEGGNLSSFNVPLNDYYNSFSISQMIYTAEEIGVKDGSIISMSFKSDVVGNTERELVVYLQNTNKEFFTGEYDWHTLTAADEAVFEGTIVTPSTSDWFTIYFSKPFEYTGGNIVVTVNDITGGYEYGDSWCSYATEQPRAIYSLSYNTPIDHLTLAERFGSLDMTSGKYINSQVKLGIVPAAAGVETPETIALGDVVLGEYWSEKVATVNVKAVNTTITNITVDNDFFVLPAEIDYTSNELVISYNRNASAGEYTGNLVITYGAGETKSVPMTATAYNAATPDVFELAQAVTFTGNAFTHTPAFANLHDSYILPEEKEDGKAHDAVYSFELTSDALITASVTGTNAVFAIYKDDFNGEGGPSANNNYEGILYTPKSFTFDFNNGALNGWTLIDNNGDGYNWEIASENGVKFAKSYAHKTQGEGEQEVTIITSADNIMMTEQAYNITANSKLSFDASRYSSGDANLDNSETYKEYIKVEVSKDGETFTMIEKVLPTAGAFGNITVDLGAKFAELGLNYGDYHIALHHQDNDGVYVSVDNVKLASVMASKAAAKSIDAVHFPAGKYYFVAAAESEFTVSLAKEEAPLTPPTEVYATEITTTTVTLVWNSVAKAESYNIYRNGTLLANVEGTQYVVSDLQVFTEYSFVIKSVVGEEESFASEAVVVKTKDLEITKPANLAATAVSSSSIKLTWSAVENALSYRVYSSNTVVATVLSTEYTVTGLEAETLYCFSVAAVRNETESEKTAEACAMTSDLTPGAPTNLVATTIDATTIGLTWDAGENATGYNIYRDGVKVGDATGLLFVDRNLTQGTDYCYTVKGVRGASESEGSSNEACATTGGTKPVPPVAPANLKAEALSTSSIKLSWYSVGNALTYNVYQGEEMIATVEIPSYTVEGLEYNTEYCFTVTAVNEEGESEKSTEVCAKTKGEGVEELVSSFNIYPNPVNDKLYIETEVEIEEVVVYDIYGRHQLAVSGQSSAVSVVNLNSGVYFVMIKTNEGVVTKRFVKK